MNGLSRVHRHENHRSSSFQWCVQTNATLFQLLGKTGYVERLLHVGCRVALHLVVLKKWNEDNSVNDGDYFGRRSAGTYANVITQQRVLHRIAIDDNLERML